jgi:hypothetical protein
LRTAGGGLGGWADIGRIEGREVGTFVVVGAAFLDLFGEAGEVYDAVVVVGVDVKELDAGAEVVHELAERARGDGPVVGGFGFVKFGVGWGLRFESEGVGGCDAWEM